MLIVAGLLIAFVVVVIFSNRTTRNCRWRADRGSDTEDASAWRCAACGGRSFTKTGKPPLICLVNSSDP
jgi:hypothetical protein